MDERRFWMPLSALVASCLLVSFAGAFDWTLLLGLLIWNHKEAIADRIGTVPPLAVAVIARSALLGVVMLPALLMRSLLEYPIAREYGIGQPALFPCKTTHRRMFPKKHAFAYSYLVAGIPVGWKGSAGGMISAEVSSTGGGGFLQRLWNRTWTWFEVHSEDHLRRGSHERGLRGKLDEFLEQEGINPSTYPYAYLITVPRLLGYSFNPVSFWYLYADNKELTAVISEVNNTFDERRPYLLLRDEPSGQLLDGIPGYNGNAQLDPTAQAPATKLRQTWAKDFHVSPFNSRKGTYSILASDPLRSKGTSLGRVDNTLTLASSKKHAKVIARLFSNVEPCDPMQMSLSQKLKFLAAWGWVVFVTVPRILWEAKVLFYARGLHVWFRPEPLSSSIGRRADAAELALEPLFRQYLRYRVQKATIPVQLKYVPSGSVASAETMASLPTKERLEMEDKAAQVEFRVLTPVFYSRFVQYAHDFEAIFCELMESCTISVSNPALLPNIFLKMPPPILKISSVTDFAYVKMAKALRRRPDRIERPLTSGALPISNGRSETATGTRVTDIREFRLSSMDGYMLTEADDRARRTYRKVVSKIMIANLVALGNLDVLWVEIFVVKLVVVWYLSAVLKPVLMAILRV